MKRLANLIESARLLAYCVRKVGLRIGLAYWRIAKACRRDPGLVVRWAERCESEARRCNLRGDSRGEAAMESWARELRGCLKRGPHRP